MRTRCYIAGRISNLPVEVYEKKFSDAKTEVENLGLEPVSPIELPHNHDKTWQSYMREDLTELLKCDVVYALNNWTDSPGATIEVKTAESLGLKVIYQK